jgi:hypothetical protein
MPLLTNRVTHTLIIMQTLQLNPQRLGCASHINLPPDSVPQIKARLQSQRGIISLYLP